MIDVVAAVIENEGKILIGKRKLGKKLAGKWEFPGGKIEKDESPEACLERELEEEFGVITKAGDFIKESIFDYEYGTIRLLCYHAKYKEGDFTLKEHDEIKWVSAGDLHAYDLASADIPFVAEIQEFYK